MIRDSNTNYFIPHQQKQKILKLTVINSPIIQHGTVIKINHEGLIGKSLRSIKDGITYFGYTEPNSKGYFNENEIDYLLPPKENSNNQFYGRYFQISYNPITNAYYLRYLDNGLGTFIRITDSMVLKDNSLINVGDSYLAFNFVSPNDTLIVKVYYDSTKKEKNEYVFEPDENIKIRIGRKNNKNDIELEDKLASKTNSIVEYDSRNGWIIKDGNETINQQGNIVKSPSTNGTWILAIEDYPIKDGMIFKGNFNLFLCSLIDTDDS